MYSLTIAFHIDYTVVKVERISRTKFGKHWPRSEHAISSFWFHALISSWVPVGGIGIDIVVEENVVVTVVWIVGIDTVTEEDEIDCVVANIGHTLVPSKCSHSPFS